MARPKKKNIEKLDSYVRCRCTNDEYASIKAKAAQAGLSVSEYVRSMALDGRVIIKQATADFTLVNELRKIGVNINQQMPVLHQHGQLPSALPPLWKKLDSLLDRIIDKV